MAHVIHETAKRLAGAGFPQPKPEQLQNWYSEEGQHNVLVLVEFYDKSSELIGETDFFAPTATDILEELPGWNLCYTNQLGWQCWMDSSDENGYKHVVFSNANPAEALAQAWFYQNEIK